MTYKFRGISIVTNSWVFGSLLTRIDSLGELFVIEVQDKEPPFEIEYHHVKKETVGQFTGWKDRHKKEIYQGDWLQGQMGVTDRENRSPIKSIVILKPGGFEVFTKAMSRCILGRFTWIDSGYYGRKDVYRVIEDIEVIGNIHEHPHLLTPAERTA